MAEQESGARQSEHRMDVVMRAMIASRGARGRMARLGPVLDRILANHDYPEVLEHLLAEALTLTALLGSLLKDPGGQLTMQAQTENGIVDLMVCDYKAGELRGYIRHDAKRLAEGPADPNLFSLFGKGYLAVTFDQPATDERYQGVVPLEGESLAKAAESFFAQSEQIPSIVRLATHKGDDGWVAGGMMFQHLPEGEEGRDRLHTKLDHPDWPHVATMAGSVKDGELVDPDLPLEAMLWRLFHEEDEVRIFQPTALSKGCRCDPDYIASVIARFPAEERDDMVDEDGMIRVDCAFCATSFPIDPKRVNSDA